MNLSVEKYVVVMSCSLSFTALGCTLEEDEKLGVTRFAALLGADSGGSSLRWNGIHWNGIHWNGVAWAELSAGQQRWHEFRVDGLIDNSLDEAGDDSLFTEALTDESVRSLFGYVVECALPSDVTLWYTDDNGDPWSFSGLHGMAPEWHSASSCNVSCQRVVSACIYARINYHGERNVLSWRSGTGIAVNSHTAGMDDPSADEDASFELDEGAVWGNLFLPIPELHVCRGTDTIAALSLPGIDLSIYGGQVPMGAIRMCAGDQECLDNVYAGPCYAHQDAVCLNQRSDNGGYDQCAAPGGSAYTEVITIRRADFATHADFVTGVGLDPQLSDCASDAENHAPTSTCVDSWDTACVDYALGAGWGALGQELGCNNGLLPPLGHSVLQVGELLSRQTSTCTAYVCAVDGSCCDDVLQGWNSDCVDLAADLCQ